MDDEGRDITPAGYRARKWVEAYSVFKDGGLDVDGGLPGIYPLDSAIMNIALPSA